MVSKMLLISAFVSGEPKETIEMVFRLSYRLTPNLKVGWNEKLSFPAALEGGFRNTACGVAKK
jgi:hypothetical protein